ncbi:MAG: hydrogenase maturation protease [Actinomycetota bacterium]|nr:hydrogenase maturation protease [Actinomycetota bacterium]
MLDDRDELSRSAPAQALIGGVPVRAGSRVVLRPRSTADILMRGLDGRRAIVSSIEQDLDDRLHVAVSLEEDPARSLGKGRQLGHRFFFSPDELEPLPQSGPAAPPPRILVAGIGNVFLGDDGFGVRVAEHLSRRNLPAGVDVVDFGIRGMDLAYALADGYRAAILVDATPRGQPPGTLEVLEPEIDPEAPGSVQAHAMDPVSVLRFARQFGTLPERTLVVGCEPDAVVDPDAGEVAVELSESVHAALEPAAELVVSLVEELLAEPNHAQGGQDR